MRLALAYRTNVYTPSQTPIRNQAGLGVISRELVDRSVVQGCGLDSGTREARVPIPRTPNLLDIRESTTHFWLPSCPTLIGN